MFSVHASDYHSVIEYTGDMTNYNQMSDFVDLNELPLVIAYEDTMVRLQARNHR